jgi:GT2 family glycosyltransferase
MARLRPREAALGLDRSPSRPSARIRSMMDLSIFIVSYNTRELTRRCLQSVFEAGVAAEHEIILVDNASADGSADMVEREFPSVKLVRSDVNLGFAAGNNLARRHARGDWLLLLNPDTRVLGDAIDRLLAFSIAHPTAGITGGRTLNDDGTLNPWSCRGRPTRWGLFCQAVGLTTAFRMHRLFDPSSLGSWQRDSVRQVDVVVGCFLMISRALWDRLGGFDEQFFMYGEETDLCLRARSLGYRPTITPDAQIVHHGAASEPAEASKLVRLFSAYVLLFRKHWAPASRAFGVSMLALWAFTRAFGGRVLELAGQRGAAGRGRVWREVWRRRRDWLAGYGPAPTSR